VSYIDRAAKLPPRTLTVVEQKKLLATSGKHRDGLRDHVIFSMTLSCGLRESEVVGLNVGDVVPLDREGSPRWPLKVKRTIELRIYKRLPSTDAAAQYVRLSDAAFFKLQKYVDATFVDVGHKPAPDSPLFRSRKGGGRMSTKAIRTLFHTWQRRAGFSKLHNFHILRHTAISNAYRDSKSIRLAQRIARHADIRTTTRYEHASDEDVERVAKGMIS
jgi:site-specific recombinase XerD